MNICIRGIKEPIFREFKAEATREKMRMGDAITEALRLWLNTHKKKAKYRFLNLRPFDWEHGSEHASEEIDKELYG